MTNLTPNRISLPETKMGVTHHFTVGGVEGYVNVGIHDGKPVELFITISKEGSTLAGWADALARVVSVSLQYGMPPDVLCRKMRHLRFEPSGFTSSVEIKEASSIVDYIFHWIQLQFNFVM